MQVSVVYATSDEQPWVTVSVPDECVLEEAVELSGLKLQYPEINLKQMRVGIFGKLAKADSPLKPGDRVEIYRPIIRDLDEDDDDED